MKKVKIIKRGDGKPKTASPVKQKPKKKRSIEGTIQDWVNERRENIDTENRTRNSKFAAWNADAVQAESIYARKNNYSRNLSRLGSQPQAEGLPFGGFVEARLVATTAPAGRPEN